MKNLLLIVIILITITSHVQAQLESCNNNLNEIYLMGTPNTGETYGIIGAGEDCTKIAASIQFVNRLSALNIGEIQFHSGWQNTKSMSIFGHTTTVHSKHFRVEKNSYFNNTLTINGSAAIFKKLLYMILMLL